MFPLPESRIRGETIAAEDVLHDLGILSMMSSDSQAMGRVGEVTTRNWQTADKMKKMTGSLPEDSSKNDNFRVKRYLAKNYNKSCHHSWNFRLCGFTTTWKDCRYCNLVSSILWS